MGEPSGPGEPGDGAADHAGRQAVKEAAEEDRLIKEMLLAGVTTCVIRWGTIDPVPGKEAGLQRGRRRASEAGSPNGHRQGPPQTA